MHFHFYNTGYVLNDRIKVTQQKSENKYMNKKLDIVIMWRKLPVH